MPKLGFFPGSTIGNFVPRSATDLLRHFRELLGTGALLLIGMDRVKPVERLIAAYDDPRRSDRAVQPQPARADQPRARRQHPARRLPPRSALERHPVAHRNASGRDAATSSSPSPASRSHSSRARRSTARTATNTSAAGRACCCSPAAGRRSPNGATRPATCRRPRRGPAQPLRALIAEPHCGAAKRQPMVTRPVRHRRLSCCQVLGWIIISQVILSWLFAFNVLNTSSQGVRGFVERARPHHRAAVPADPPDAARFRRDRLLAAGAADPDPDPADAARAAPRRSLDVLGDMTRTADRRESRCRRAARASRPMPSPNSSSGSAARRGSRPCWSAKTRRARSMSG